MVVVLYSSVLHSIVLQSNGLMYEHGVDCLYNAVQFNTTAQFNLNDNRSCKYLADSEDQKLITCKSRLSACE